MLRRTACRILPFAALAAAIALFVAIRAGVDGARGAAVRQPRRLSPRHHDGLPGRAEIFRSGPDAFLRVQSRRSDSGVQAGHRARSRVRDVLLGRGVRVGAEHQRADHRGRREGGVAGDRAGAQHRGVARRTRNARTSTRSRSATPPIPRPSGRRSIARTRTRCARSSSGSRTTSTPPRCSRSR